MTSREVVKAKWTEDFECQPAIADARDQAARVILATLRDVFDAEEGWLLYLAEEFAEKTIVTLSDRRLLLVAI